jgi:pSer/pThr/pTyr-binding forkhead associated (FHA) protein
MFRLGWKKKDAPHPESGTAGATQASIGDEWAYLRQRPDFDPAEMASVHASQPAAPGVSSVEDDLAFLRRRPDFDADEMASVHSATPSPVRNAFTSAYSYSATRSAGEAVADPAAAGAAVTPGAEQPVFLSLQINIGRRALTRAIWEETLIGRRDRDQEVYPGIDLSQDEAVSRRHALIRVKEGQYLLSDRGSLNGTALNGEWLDPEADVPLQAGDEIRLGAFTTIRVLEALTGSELTTEDALLGDMLQEALGTSPAETQITHLRREPRAARSEPGPEAPAGASEPAAEKPARKRRTLTPPVQESPTEAPPAGAAPIVDVLDLALERGHAAGLVTPSDMPPGGGGDSQTGSPLPELD